MGRDWEFYLTEVDHKPASISLDLALRDQAPIEQLPIRVVFRLFLRTPREDGLSTQEEFERLSQIEEVLFQSAKEADTPVLFVGRVTFGGFRDFFFYSADDRAPRTLLSTAMTAFPEYQFEVEAAPEPDWSTYLGFLYPSARDRRVIQNRRVLETLASHGDVHEQPREVTHWIYFANSNGRQRYQAIVQKSGFQIVDSWENEEEDGDQPMGLQIARVDRVDYHSINEVVLYLHDKAIECKGNYDGWETQVTIPKPDGAAETES